MGDGHGTDRFRTRLARDLSPAGPPEEGRICEPSVTTEKVRTKIPQPVRRRPVPPTDAFRVRWVGTFALPIAGAYRPWAHLYADSDGALWWTVRLWESDHAMPHVTTTERLRRFARESGLPSVLRAIDRTVQKARRPDGR